MHRRPTTWLITGVTGFLGKVLLEELIRRREEFQLAEVIVLVRSRKGRGAAERFQREVARAACFAGLPAGWTDLVTTLDVDLSRPDLGIRAEDQHVFDRVTHVVHSAASVSFDLPVAEAARANITPSLNLLAMMGARPALERFVYVSTAYVTPHAGDTKAIDEALVELPFPASELLAEIHAGASDAHMLARTGHPNTYTLTKCLAERLLVERRGTVRISIVRPSVISASRALPFPGWIDSTAGFGAFATLIGLGHLRAIVGEPGARLDVMPVDEVSQRITHAALLDAEPVQIRHAVAGLDHSPLVRECQQEVERWFRVHRTERRPGVGFLGRDGVGFRLADLWHHRVPMAIGAMRSELHRRRARKLAVRLAHLNSVFPYFTTKSFDFRVSLPLPATHHPRNYIATICRGLYRHVLRRDDREWPLAGRTHLGHDGDARWAMGQPRGNAWVRSAIVLVTKVLRRTTDSVTVDLPSFERAREAIPTGAAIVLVPSHRSYLDFVLCSYLAFARPDLGLPIPHIAATMEFGRIPLLGRILSALHAFYLRRGTGKADPELTARVHTLVTSGRALEFFIEGARSRSREWLPPKRGLLRCLQGTGVPSALIPISISYDRVPEEASFATELEGAAKPPMRLTSLLRWCWRAWRGEIALGRIHIAAGKTVLLDQASDVPVVADAVVSELREAMAVTSFHLSAYLRHHPMAGHDTASLRLALEGAGVRVLESALEPDDSIHPAVARTFGEHFLDRMGAAAPPAPPPKQVIARQLMERAG